MVFSNHDRQLTALVGFDWHLLPPGSVIVDVGGGIGSTTMQLANTFSRGGDHGGLDLRLEFVIQDRQVVVEMGEKVSLSLPPIGTILSGLIGMACQMSRIIGFRNSEIPRQVLLP